ncbi:MAG: hypothetical protein EFKGCFLK_01863 [Rhodocyclaceae bacterium]|nr:hypothetical protein [Rhodocyclaceae bacterium]CAG0944048.1 hypothetical protein GPROT2_02408 [Gammaproteobacteria bacterium]
MKARDCVLTLVFPVSLEEELVDHLLEHPEWVIGFTSTRVDGQGQVVRLHGSAEEVRGRSRRVQVEIAMNREDAQALVAHLKESLPNPEIAYWLLPLIEFGRFA